MTKSSKVKDLMTPAPRVLHRNDTLTLADELMRAEQFRHLPVLDEYEKLCGIVSQRDIFRGALIRALGYGERAEAKLLESVKVKEAMTREPVTIGPEDTVATAAARMIDKKIGCLPVVVEDGTLVGMLTETDLLRALT
jgi:CBS domain-containing protein